MNREKELRSIISRTRALAAANRDMGVDFSKYSKEIRDFVLSETPRPEGLKELEKAVIKCTECGLAKTRKNPVFGEGPEKARLVFVAEGPGREEDMEGRPFVGEAGKLLTNIIEKGMGLKREDVYLCNVVKCHPPGNREPQKNEQEACLPFLKKQLEIIRPEVICTLGKIAAQSLLGREVKITQERGKWGTFMNIPLMPTYHPAYILRNPARDRELKGEVWMDIQAVMARLGLEVKKND